MKADVVAVSPEALATRAATIDELLSDDFESLPALKRDTDRATKRLAAWCNSSTSGDWELFYRRLRRDGHTVADVLTRFGAARRRSTVPLPQWARDADWIQVALHSHGEICSERAPFEHIFSGLADEADIRLWTSADASVTGRFASSARDDLRALLIDSLCGLCAPAVYERFVSSSAGYHAFVEDMTAGGLSRLFDEKPVLLRLVATTTRQWLTTSSELLNRLDGDLERIRHNILHRDAATLVTHVEGGLSDPHHGGRAVLRVEFDDSSSVMYKPRDLRLDVAWHSLVERLNREAPIELRAPEAIACEGYGWTEFIAHFGCNSEQECPRFFRRAGAWLALLHSFAASDIHHENIIAAGDQPVPIDVETLLQGGTTRADVDSQALEAARELIANSVVPVGLLPSYGESADGIHAAGGVASEWPSGTKLVWNHINSDAMRPAMVPETKKAPTNLPRIGMDRHVGLAEHIEDFISGFREYATFLYPTGQQLFDGFAELPVRKVLRPTRFYSMLMQRLKDDRTMDDGVLWSSQADFVARLSDWDSHTDDGWLLQRAERDALLDLNVPLFAAPTDVRRAQDRVRALDTNGIAWQVDVIRHTSPDSSGVRPRQDGARACQMSTEDVVALPSSAFLGEAELIAEEIADHAIRAGPGAAWIGVGWFADSDAAQLAVLGHDLYNGACGIATFLAAHCASLETQTRPTSLWRQSHMCGRH